jgi:hypothetical protein
MASVHHALCTYDHRTTTRHTHWHSCVCHLGWLGVGETTGSGFSINNNRISGTFPSIVSGLDALSYISIPFNQIGGTFPSIVSGLDALV